MLADHFDNLALAISIYAVGFVIIGPNILAIIGTSMARGRRDGAKLALGISAGSGLWASLTVFGLAALISAYAGAIVALKLLGAAYLSWMACNAFRSARSPDVPSKITQATGPNLFLRGLIIQMTNPKAALQWIAVVAIGLGPDAPFAVGLVLILSATVLSTLAHLAYAVTFSTRPVVWFYDRARRWIDGGLGIFFTYFAFRLAMDRS